MAVRQHICIFVSVSAHMSHLSYLSVRPSLFYDCVSLHLRTHRGLARTQDEERVFAGRKMTRDEVRELEKKKEVLRLARDYNATTVDKSQRCVSV